MYVCLGLESVCTSKLFTEAEEGGESPRTGVAGVCESLDMDAWNQTPVLCKNPVCFYLLIYLQSILCIIFISGTNGKFSV